MNENDIKEYLTDFYNRELPDLTARSIQISKSNKIVSIIGPRRAGKTYLMFQKMKELIQQGVRRDSIIYLNFEDARLIDVSFKEMRSIVKIHWQMHPSAVNEQCRLFIDEPHNVANWEIGVRSLYDDGCMIMLSGSSSKLLSSEIATSLRGRTLSYTLLPFSFREYLTSRAVAFNPNALGSKQKAILLSHLDNYLDYGGFPEIINSPDADVRKRTLGEYFNLIVYRDIVERYKIKNLQLIKWLIRDVTSSFSKEFSVHKTFLMLKSRGMKVSKNTLYSYLAMLEDALLVFMVRKFGHSFRKGDFSINKLYLCDTGFAKLSETSRNVGYKMENIVFLELERRKEPLSEILYWRNYEQEEVDFVVRDGPAVVQLIQVCYEINDDVKKREVRALIKAGAETRCKNLTIITYDYEAIEKREKQRVRYVPLWKWLMME